MDWEATVTYRGPDRAGGGWAESEQLRFTFVTTADRDRFMDLMFSGRKSHQAPGYYTLPDGRLLRVFCESIVVWQPVKCKEGRDVRLRSSGR